MVIGFISGPENQCFIVMLRPVRLGIRHMQQTPNPHPQNVTMKASESECLPPRDRMRLTCLECPTHQPIKLLPQK